MRNLVLIGFMGTGKSTLGRLCAEKLGYLFRDTDALIAARAGRSIPELFAEEGEAAFRQKEREIVRELAAQSGQVIATGGGTILDAENAARLRDAGFVVALHARPETILSRVGETASRPLLASSADPHHRITELLARRKDAYARHKHHALDTDDRSAEELTECLLDLFLQHRHLEQRAGVRRVQVELAERSYPIFIRQGLIETGIAPEQIAEFADCKRACIVTHPGLLERYAKPVAAGLADKGIGVTTITIPAGERYKTLKTVERLYNAFLEARLDRKGLVVAVGGGVLGDTVGFAAASYLRGVRFAQVPTTLLAQVDSSVGGKTGVDLPAGKNLVGAFHQPSLVVIDPLTLHTLPPRELRSGLAEVIKYGIIYDKDFFEQIVQDLPALLRRESDPLAAAIARSCEIKAEVVGQDETEQGLRAILNYGHTVGHALEAVTRYRRYKHGEAIAIGMVSAALIGEELGVTPAEVTQRIADALVSARLPILFPQEIETKPILEAAQRDKKTEAGKLRFVLARAIGEVFLQNDVPADAIAAALLRQRAGNFAHA